MSLEQLRVFISRLKLKKPTNSNASVVSVNISLSCGSDRTPRAGFYVFPRERKKNSLQSGTNRIIQKMAAVCTSLR